jgi:hypothetical protein
MPATNEEIIECARRFYSAVMMPDDVNDVIWSDGSQITEQEVRTVTGLQAYDRYRKSLHADKPQRRALRTLRRFLTPEQRKQLRNENRFRVVGSLGGAYRLEPCRGRVFGLERHGKNWYEAASFCMIDCGQGKVPRADTTIGHLMLLRADEGAFLAEANRYTSRLPDCWNGEYLRRIRQATRERREAVRDAQ